MEKKRVFQKSIVGLVFFISFFNMAFWVFTKKKQLNRCLYHNFIENPSAIVKAIRHWLFMNHSGGDR